VTRILDHFRYRRCPNCGHLAAVVTTGFAPAPLMAHVRRVPLWIRHRGCPDTPVSIASRPAVEAPLADWERAILAEVEVEVADVRAAAYSAGNGETGDQES
jgi:hypothetical protein